MYIIKTVRHTPTTTNPAKISICLSFLKSWWAPQDLNLYSADYESDALTSYARGPCFRILNLILTALVDTDLRAYQHTVPVL